MSVQTRKVETVSVLRADMPYPAVLLIGRLDANAGAVASFDFTAIPATYSKLILDLYARGDTAATNVAVNMICNNDGSALYDRITSNIHHSGVLATGETLAGTNIQIATIAAAAAPASAFDLMKLEIPGYGNTNVHKVLQAQFGLKLAATTTNLYVSNVIAWYRSTNAISRLTLTPAAGNFAQYSTARLYGVY